MSQRAFAPAALALLTLPLAGPLAAAPVDDLLEALRIEETLTVMRAEGLDYGDTLAQEMFGGPTRGWDQAVERIYDMGTMRAAVRAGFDEELTAEEIEPLIDFFSSDLGQEVVTLEIEARRAMLDSEVEEAARDRYAELAGTEDARLAQVSRFIEVNDLVEQNVSGALNASFAFYEGLADGGALEMGEAEMLSDIWGQEEETRADTVEWVHGYLLMAYGPLSSEELGAYVEMSESPEGGALNRALFSGFNQMYNDISYAMGLAAAGQMAGTDL